MVHPASPASRSCRDDRDVAWRGATMIDYSRAYHHGVRVADLDVAMAEIGPALGVTWCEPLAREQTVWLPETGLQSIPLRFTYSREGPQHIELLQGRAGSIWDGADQPGVHHIGVWSDDVAGDTQALVEQGWEIRLA